MANQGKSISSINVTFLGTASAQPSKTRNHSSLALRLGGVVWLFDCGEATQHQIQKSTVKMGKIEKIFITHTHGDHFFGIVPLMASRLDGAGGMAEGEKDTRTQLDMSQPPLEIYGPLGTRAYIRSSLKYTHSFLASPYVVHELRLPSDPQSSDFTELPLDRAELPNGRNIPMVSDRTWPSFVEDDFVAISAAPIHHSCPCVGYVVNEKPLPGKIDPKDYIPHLKRNNARMSLLSAVQQGQDVTLADGTVLTSPPKRPGRKIVILGDTYDPSPIADLAKGADLLIHEATNAHLPHIPRFFKQEDTGEVVEERTKSRGHSTPQMAGAFAKKIEARKLILNHFSSRYPGDDHVNEESREIMESIRHLALEQYSGREVLCARDMMSIDIPLPS